MTNPYGYPASPQPGYGGYPQQQPGYFPRRTPSGATAIIAAVLGLGLAGVAGYLPIKVFIEYGVDRLGGEGLTLLGLYLGAAVFLLIAALLTFFRVVAGAVLLIVGALLALAAALLQPALLYESEYGAYFEVVFTFKIEDAFVPAGAMVLGPLVLILAALPPTFRYLGHKQPAMSPYGPPQGYPPQGW